MRTTRKVRAYGLHESTPGPNPNLDDINLQTNEPFDGKVRPLWDTLIAVANDSDLPVDVVLKAFDQAGQIQQWTGGPDPSSDSKRYTLQPTHGYAMTFIPNNVFPDSPTDWVGHVEVEFQLMSTAAGPFASLPPLPPPHLFLVGIYLGGGGWVKQSGDDHGGHWNANGQECQLTELGPEPSLDPVRTIWRCPSAITFETKEHFGPLSYRTGLSIQNGEDHQVSGRLTFTEFDWYNDNQAIQYQSDQIDIPPSGSVVSHVEEFIPELTTIGNREGWLKFETDEAVRLFFQTLIMNQSGKHYMSGVPWI